MKRFSKIISIGLSALMLVSTSSVLAGAATSKNMVKVVSCSKADCKNVQNILKQLKNCKTCDLTGLIKSGGGYCPDGNCSTKTPVKIKAKFS